MTARILVIEDNPADMELIVYLLTAFGHASLSAYDGSTGVNMALGAAPDLVICDVNLPVLDGYGVIREIRKNPHVARIPIVAVTAMAMVGDREKLLAAGFDGYVSKPIEPEVFVQIIEQFLHAAGSRSGGNATSDTGVERNRKITQRPSRLLMLANSADLPSRVVQAMEPFPQQIVTISTIADAELQLQQGEFALALVEAGPDAEYFRERLAAIGADASPGNMLPVIILQPSDSAEVLADQIQACLQEKNRSQDGDHTDR